VRRDAKEADMYNVFIFDHPPDSAQSSLLRDKKTTTKEFRDLSAKLRS
jgi:uracil phosphoribosyltransferase